MNIDQNYLAKIFEGDQLFVLAEESDKVEYKAEPKTANTAEVKEPQIDMKAEPQEAKAPSKEVVILVNEDLGSHEKETLSKLLKAINIEEGQYEIIHEHPEQLKSIQHLKLFLSFHSHYVQSDKYSVLKINRGNAIYAHDLSELNQDTSKKVILWNLLKTIV
jgi:DNA polymerase III psi subunit